VPPLAGGPTRITLPPLTVAPSRDHFVEQGSPTVLCADTVWASFAEARPDDWQTYLSRRRSQGFTALLISVLPIVHDRTVQSGSREPFPVDGQGRYDFSAPDEGYFRSARELVEAAAEHGLRSTLVALWCNYVPGSRGLRGEPNMVMTEEQTRAYLDLLTEVFSAYSPIYVASGDDKFDTPEVVERYGWVVEHLTQRAPDCLTTLHSTPDTDLPDQLAEAPGLDFYSYQSGHGHQDQEKAYDLAALYRGKRVRRPIVNLEPCYEGHGYGSGRGRYTRTEVRRATWWSLLGGAAAGIGYGAHGMWSWHRPNGRFTSGGWSGEPFPWQVALGFDGAWDVGFARMLMEDHGLYHCQPRQDLIAAASPGVRLAATPDLSTVAVYVPHPFDVELAVDLGGYAVTGWDLHHRRRVRPVVGTGPTGTVLRQPTYLSDSVYVLSR
jgi:hypothetical protein